MFVCEAVRPCVCAGPGWTCSRAGVGTLQPPTDAVLVRSSLKLNSVFLRDCFDEEVKRHKFLVCQTRTVVGLNQSSK